MNVNISTPQRLKALFVATVLGAAAIEGSVLAQQHHVHTGKDAFLHYQVDSTDELITALKNNPTLRANYAKHFGIPQDQVIDFIKRTLVTYRLPTGRAVTTYGVTKAGKIYPVKTYLKKGTMVWATRSGLPILKWACANPLTTHIPGTLLSEGPVKTAPHSSTPKLPLVATVPSNLLSTPTTPGNPGTIAVPVYIAPVGNASSALMLPPVLVGSGAATTPAIAAVPTPVAVATKSNHNSGILPLIPVLLGAGAMATHHGSTGSPALTRTPISVANTPAVPVLVVPMPTPGISVSPVVGSTPVANVPVATPAPGTPTTPVTIPTSAPTGPVVTIPTPKPGIPVAVPTPSVPSAVPTPSVPVAVPTPSVPVAVPTPGTPVAVPTPTVPVAVPTPGVPVAVPTPAPTVPVFVPTPAPSVPTVPVTPGTPTTPGIPITPGTPTTPGIPITPGATTPPGTPNAMPEPSSIALALLAGIPVLGGFIARRRNAAK